MKWLSVDPGEDVGWALWEDDTLVQADTYKLREFLRELHVAYENAYSSVFSYDNYEMKVQEHPLQGLATELIVCEDFALYPWKLKEMGWDKCRTARLIGGIETIGMIYNIPIVLQPAAIKKQAEAGGAELLFLKPLHENRHANDAIRHGVYYVNHKYAQELRSTAKSKDSPWQKNPNPAS